MKKQPNDIAQVTLYIDSGKGVDLVNHTIVVAVPIGGKEQLEGATVQHFEWVPYKYVNALQEQMEEVSKVRKDPHRKDCAIVAIVDLHRRLILKIIEISLAGDNSR